MGVDVFSHFGDMFRRGGLSVGVDLQSTSFPSLDL